jgi:hypothetical protein
MLLRRSASRVPHSARPSSHLCHFPLSTALPCALVGRHPHEYSWHSVPFGLAPGRPSHVPSQRNVRERRRCPIHALQCARCASSMGQDVPQTKAGSVASHSVGYADGLPTSVRFHHWTLGFGSSNSHHIAQVLQDHNIPVFGCPLLYDHALVPSPFRV